MVGGPRSESEEYDSLQSDTDTEHGTSSRTESSIHLDSATLDTRPHPHLHLPLDPTPARPSEPVPHQQHQQQPQPSHVNPQHARKPHAPSRNVHHNLIYHAPESSTSTEPSPILERKSFPRKLDVTKGLRAIGVGSAGRGAGAGGGVGAFTSRAVLGRMAANFRGSAGTQETSLSIPKKMVIRGPHADPNKNTEDAKYGFAHKINPPAGFSLGSHNELSEAECDLEMRKRAGKDGKDGGSEGPYIGHARSQFRSYVPGRGGSDGGNKDYSIKV